MADIKKVLLTGATGFIGCHLQTMLQAEGYEVVPISKSLGIDFNQMISKEHWFPYLEGVDAVINAVGIIVETRGQKFENCTSKHP